MRPRMHKEDRQPKLEADEEDNGGMSEDEL